MSVTAAGPPPPQPGMSVVENTMADRWATGISIDTQPIQHVRAGLDAAAILTAVERRTAEPARRVRVAGVVTHRQRPATASRGDVHEPRERDRHDQRRRLRRRVAAPPL